MTVVVYVLGVTEIPSLKNFLLDYSLLHIYSPHQPDVFAPLVQSWTLSTEIAFYLFIPIWSWLLARFVRGSATARVRTELLGIGGLIALSAAWKGFVLSAGFSDARIGQLKLWLPWWLDLFAVGMALAVLSLAVQHLGRPVPARLDRRFAPVVCWLGALAAFWWVAAGAGLGHTSAAIAHELLWGQHYLYGATAVLLILPAVFGPQDRSSSRIRGFLQTRVMVYLGVISYGIYLWHEGWIDRFFTVMWFDAGMRLPPLVLRVVIVTSWGRGCGRARSIIGTRNGHGSCCSRLMGCRTVDIGETVGMHYNQVAVWRNRYREFGLAGLDDGDRSGRPPVYGHDDVLLLVKTVTEPPPDDTRAGRWKRSPGG